MRPLLLPAAQRLARFVLRTRGVCSHRVETPHARIHAYEAVGHGPLPTTVLLHGLGSAATPFAPVLIGLSRTMQRVVAPEYPGHGFSEGSVGKLTPDVLLEAMSMTLEQIVDEPAIVVGNSLGGALAIQYALSNPKRVRALVLVSPAGARATEDEWAAIKNSFDLTTRKEARTFLERVYHRSPWFLPLVAHEFPAMLRRREVVDLLQSSHNDDLPTPTALRSLEMPVLLLWGRSERLLPESHYDYFARYLPKHATLERPDGFGHCPHFDSPRELVARIVAFAESV